MLMKLDGLIECEVLKRPSKMIKTPYVADIIDKNGCEILGHTPSLGCCGLVDVGSKVLVSQNPNKKASYFVSQKALDSNKQLFSGDPSIHELLNRLNRLLERKSR
jgi:hypothetical protein